LVGAGIEIGTSGFAARNSDHQTREAAKGMQLTLYYNLTFRNSREDDSIEQEANGAAENTTGAEERRLLGCYAV
jgi:hypothetical protein